MGPCIAMKRRPSTNQATRRRRQRKISVERRLESPRWPNHRTHAESSQMECACEVEFAIKSKYPCFGSRRWVARDRGCTLRQGNLAKGTMASSDIDAASILCKYKSSSVKDWCGDNTRHPRLTNRDSHPCIRSSTTE